MISIYTVSLLGMLLLWSVPDISVEHSFIQQQDTTSSPIPIEDTKKSESGRHWLLILGAIVLGVIGCIVLFFAFSTSPIPPKLIVIGFIYILAAILAILFNHWLWLVGGLAIGILLLKMG